ncbi:MAG: hypothetical protein IH998_09285 [Proteobacteria bacterium]|nr:hypothetical protein [Pseudomonadota bacterium]
MTQHDQQEAPHFTREWLLSALRYVRGDFEAAASGEADDNERARSRMRTARALGLDALAPDVLSAIDEAVERISALQWPGGLEVRYLALVGALREIFAVGHNLSGSNLPGSKRSGGRSHSVETRSRMRSVPFMGSYPAERSLPPRQLRPGLLPPFLQSRRPAPSRHLHQFGRRRT